MRVADEDEEDEDGDEDVAGGRASDVGPGDGAIHNVSPGDISKLRQWLAGPQQ